MGNKYTVVGDFRQPHKDCLGETLSDLSYEDAVELYVNGEKRKNIRMFSISSKTKLKYRKNCVTKGDRYGETEERR